MENNDAGKVELSSFIVNFFESLEQDSNYASLLEQPFKNAENRNNLFCYLNMDVIGAYLLKLKAMDSAGVNTFMSNGLEWVNKTVAANQDGVKDGDARQLVYRYVNLLALLAGAPTIFMKIGALTMFSTALDTVKDWC